MLLSCRLQAALALMSQLDLQFSVCFFLCCIRYIHNKNGWISRMLCDIFFFNPTHIHTHALATAGNHQLASAILLRITPHMHTNIHVIYIYIVHIYLRIIIHIVWALLPAFYNNHSQATNARSSCRHLLRMCAPSAACHCPHIHTHMILVRN